MARRTSSGRVLQRGRRLGLRVPRCSRSRATFRALRRVNASKRLREHRVARSRCASGRGAARSAAASDLHFDLLGRQRLVRGRREHGRERRRVVPIRRSAGRRSPSSVPRAPPAMLEHARSMRPPPGPVRRRRADRGAGRAPARASAPAAARAAATAAFAPARRARRAPAPPRVGSAPAMSRVPAAIRVGPREARRVRPVAGAAARRGRARRSGRDRGWRRPPARRGPRRSSANAVPSAPASRYSRQRHRACERVARTRALPRRRTKSSGILAVGQEQEARFLAVGEHRQRVLERAPRGLAPGGVAVEAEHDRVGEPKELLRVHRRRRRCRASRPRSRCRAGRARRRPCSLRRRARGRRRGWRCAPDTGRRARVPSRRRRFRRVEVFRLAGVEHPPAEADHAAARVVDREHDAVAEAVVALAVVAAR